MNPTYDALVIGGGIMGCASAYELAKAGLKVGLLEKADLGAGSTGQSSAIIRQHYSNEVTARMALYSLRVFQQFGQEVGGDSGFLPSGFLALAPAAEVEGLRANVELQRSVGIQTEVLDLEAVRQEWPQLDLGDLQAAAFEPESGYADPNLTLRSYADAAKRQGATIHLDTEVTGVRFAGGAVTGVDTADQRFDSPVVVNCAGLWGARVAAMAGIEVPITPCRVQVAFFRRPAGHERAHPVVLDFTQAVYWRSETGALTLVGRVDPAEAEDVIDPDAFDTHVEQPFVLDVGERLVHRYPAMLNSEVAGGYASGYAVTPDWHPVIDEAPAGSGFFVCAGFSGHGFKLGPAVGRMVADMVLGVATPGLERNIFRLARYAEGDLVRGRYEYSIAG